MKNLGQLMKQAQEMQTKMGAFQEQLGAIEISGVSGGGLVTVTLNGKSEMRGIEIDPSLIKPDETEILEDLITAAHNDAKTKLEARIKDETAKMMGGLDLPPGFKLPF
jgi:DNA-binding YbaB/EbfC family protein